MTPTPSVFVDELIVTVRSEQYVFRVPSIRYEIEVAGRAASVRRKADPEGSSPYEIGQAALRLSYGIAVLELYLKAGPAWLFSPGPTGEPVVKHENFSPRHTSLVYELLTAFEDAYGRFRESGVVGDVADSAKTVAGV